MKELNQRFGRLTVIGEDRTSRGRRLICRCDCGTIKSILPGNLRSGTTKSCGCLRKQHLVTHGRSKTRLYHIWTTMIQRCENPKTDSFKRYGARGITVCKAWHVFEAFASWADANGYAGNLSIDRKHSSRGYSPSNCRWVTSAEQAFNRRKASGKSSVYIGVNWSHQHNKWRARVSFRGRQYELGMFKSGREAAEARDKRAIELHGEFAKLNFPLKRAA